MRDETLRPAPEAPPGDPSSRREFGEPDGFIVCSKHEVGHHKNFECGMCQLEGVEHPQVTIKEYLEEHGTIRSRLVEVSDGER